MAGLNIGRLVRVVINLAVLAAQRRGFGTLLIMGDTDIIDGVERIRQYTALESIAADFGTTSPEYIAAALYYAQSPKPLDISIGRWLRTATNASLRGAVLTTAEQLIATWNAVTAGSTRITIDGTLRTLSAMNFSTDTNLNLVAARIQAALVTAGATGATVIWNGQRFITKSGTTGITSTIGYYSATGAGTDISTMLKSTVATGLAPVNGLAAESPVAAVTALADLTQSWYGVMFAASVQPSVAQALLVAEFVEAATTTRIYGYTETDTRASDATFLTDIGTQLKGLNRRRTFVHYSSNSYAVASFFGRAFSTNFNAVNSTITLMYKQAPGITAEQLTESQAAALKFKRINAFVAYSNDTAIIQNGVMSGSAYFDEMHGLDWFQNALQNELYNLLYQSKTKVPQTDEGMNQLVNVAASVCDEAINNRLAAPGKWNGDPFGQLAQGDYLKSGYYIYAQPMALQAQSIREQRIAPPMTIALKLAGAIHEIDAIINVNR
jgi:Protein of unknown function (DUF3383)